MFDVSIFFMVWISNLIVLVFLSNNVYNVVWYGKFSFKNCRLSCMCTKSNKSNLSMFHIKRIKSKLIWQSCLTEIWTARDLLMRQSKLNETDTLKLVSHNTIRCFFNLLIQKSECNLDPKIQILGSTRYTKVRLVYESLNWVWIESCNKKYQ